MGCFICGLICFHGCSTSTIAELWGLVYGLRLACGLGINSHRVETKSLTVVGMVKSHTSQNHHLLPLIRETLVLMDRNY